MRIKELQLVGFKSFQDKTTLRFSPGLNAVIGPNGCGKTNVLDALRWVLGEQSFTLLRCAKNEDLVFAGTATVAPVNYAEVRLVLDDVPDPRTESEGQRVTEVEVRRRYFRSGESEYYLNREPCRLRDIQEVFFSTVAGTKAYSLFDLRQMREVISGNVRTLFEEAASLAKYRDAKDDCRRKLELTASDLLRLEDIMAERERYVRSLQRQAGKQRAHEKLRGEEKDLRLLELRADYNALHRDLERARTDTEAMEMAEAARVAEIRRLDEELKRQRSRVRDLQALKDELAAQVQAQRQTLSGLEGQDMLARQRIELLATATSRAETERAALTEEMRQLEQTFTVTVGRLGETSEQLIHAQQELEGQQGRVRTLEQRLYELRSHEAALKHQVQELLEQAQARRAELARLDATMENQRENAAKLAGEWKVVHERLVDARHEVETEQQKVGEAGTAIETGRQRLEGLRAELTRTRDDRNRIRAEQVKLRDERAVLETELAVLRAELASEQTELGRTVLAESWRGEASAWLEVSPGWERACEAALYAVLDFLVADPIRPAKLTELTDLRADFQFHLLTPHPSPLAPHPSPLAPPPDLSILGRLSDFVKLKPQAPGLLAWLASSCLVAGSTSDLDRLAGQYPDWTFVTRDGICRFADGRVVIARREGGRLSATQLLAEKVERLRAAAARLDAVAADEAALARRREELEREVEQVEFEVGESSRQKAAVDASLAFVSAGVEELGRDAERLQAARHEVAAQLRSGEDKRLSLAATHGELEARLHATTQALQQTEGETQDLEQQVKAGLELSAQALSELALVRQLASRLETENAFLKRQLDGGRRRLQEYAATAEANRSESKRLEAELAERSTVIEQARAQLAELDAQAGALHLAELTRAEEAIEANLGELRRSQEQNQNLLMEQRLKLYELNQRLVAIREEARAGYGADITPAPDLLPQGEKEEVRQCDEAQVAAAEPGSSDFREKLAQIRSRLEALGEVNPLAAQEYKQEKSDLERLVAQRDDVVTAKQNLENTLTEIDGHAREQFAATYVEVRGHFREIFKALFLEGEADLVMTNEADPLESEIGIVAKPRGKNPRRLEQLSDGEKALLAVSLLFAFYRVKPAPFCFLDEVDAPLDDANVGRVADYLKEISRNTQIVVITHNRLTVERADVIFGVTAEQPGISKLVSVSLADYRREEEGGEERGTQNEERGVMNDER